MTDDIAKSVVKSTGLMTVATLASRFTGLIRTWAMAFALGNTLVSSAYTVANNLPNVIYELVAGGLLSAAFLPVLILARTRDGDEGANRFGSNILNLCLIVLGVLSLLACIFADQVVATQTFTVGDQAAVSIYAVMFFRIFAIQIVFYGLGGVITGILNAQRSYFLTSIAPALNNLFCIAAFFIYVALEPDDPDMALTVLAWGTSLGVAAQFLIQVPALRKVGFKWRPVIDLHDPALRETLKIAVPTVIFIVGNLVAYSCRNAFSLMAGDEGPATLNYAWTWFQLPYGVVAVSLSRAMFTEMSDAVAKEDWQGLRRYVNRGLRGTLFLIIPLAALVFIMSPSLIQLFRAGAFTADDVDAVAFILMLWVCSLPLYSMYMYLYNTFASLRRFMPYAIMNICLVGVQCGLYALLCDPEMLGLAGVPLADFAYYLLGVVGAMIMLKHFVGSCGGRGIVWMALRTFFASALGVCVAILILIVLPIDGTSMLIGIIQLLTAGLAGLVVAFAFCRLFRIEEMDIIVRLFGRIGAKLGRGDTGTGGKHAR